jgi:hypothetical protein
MCVGKWENDILSEKRQQSFSTHFFVCKQSRLFGIRRIFSKKDDEKCDRKVEQDLQE